MYTRLANTSANNSKSAFTLIELLAVVAVVIILTGITFGIKKGVVNTQARTQAQAELAMIAQALEEFKLAYGDYPIISLDGDPTTGSANAKNLMYALVGYGKQGWQEVTDSENNTTKQYQFDQVKSGNAKRFIDPSRLNYAGNKGFVAPGEDDDGDLISDTSLVDPWQQPYVYVYNKGKTSWDNTGYVLFSKGPDRLADLGDFQDTGIVDESSSNNLDNIYPNQ